MSTACPISSGETSSSTQQESLVLKSQSFLLLQPVRGEAIESLESSRSCIVADRDDVRRLWEQGAFGCSTRSTRFKPAFLNNNNKAKSKQQRRRSSKADGVKGAEEEVERSESMQLNLMELKYLVEETSLAANCVIATGPESNEEIVTKAPQTLDALLANRFSTDGVSFKQQYHAYRTFRQAGFIPKNGAQYGFDYVLYRKHPEQCHSKFCVSLEDSTKPGRILDRLTLLRAAEQTRKTLVMCDGQGECVQFKRWVLKHEQAEKHK